MPTSRMDHLRRQLAAVALCVATAPFLMGADNLPGRETLSMECFGENNERRIEACTALLGTPLSMGERSFAFAMRALAYSLRGDYDRAIPDYDEALRISPDFAIALNNRAWALFKSGRPEEGAPDVARALELNPTSPHALDTRAHIRQVTGDPQGALADYNAAMRYGGTRMVKLYQCGLQAHGLYIGSLDGIITPSLRAAMETCVKQADCDPLPPDEECRKLTS